MNTEENNKLIAEFMEEESAINSMGEWRCKHSKGRELWLDVRNLCYHTFWDWLMPVVEEIEHTKFVDEFKIIWDSVYQTHVCEILPARKDTFNVFRKESDIKIKATYNAVVEFINWYNEHES